MCLGLTVAGAALLAGFMTPYASLLLALCIFIAIFSPAPASLLNLLGPKHLAALLIIIAVAIAFLGPGAYSADGYLFGRREIVIPPRTPES